MAIRRNPPACNTRERLLQYRMKVRKEKERAKRKKEISKDVKRGLIYPVIFFHRLNFKNAVLFSPRDQPEMAADAHACEKNV